MILMELKNDQVELTFDNIFDAITEDKDEAQQLKIESDQLIKQRDDSELDHSDKGGKLKSIIKGAAKDIISHAKIDQSFDD